MKNIITLIGSKLAKTGLEFLYVGEVEECNRCKFKNLCHGKLEKGRVYKIVSVRSSEHPCEIHNDGVKVVEVCYSNIILCVDTRKAIEGVVLQYSPNRCTNFECENYIFCHPEGIKEGDKFKITKILNEKVKCPKNNNFKKVVVEIIHNE